MGIYIRAICIVLGLPIKAIRKFKNSEMLGEHFYCYPTYCSLSPILGVFTADSSCSLNGEKIKKYKRKKTAV